MRRIAVVIQPGVQAADLASLLDVFSAANRDGTLGEGYDVALVARTRSPVRATNGLRIVPDLSFASADGPFAAVVLPGLDGSMMASANDDLITWLDRAVRPVAALAAAVPAARPASALDSSVEQVRKHVAAHLREPLSVGRLAAVCGMSPRHFARVFRLETGLTPRVFVEAARIERARELLSDTQLPLKAIAFECGFRSPNRLRLAFAKRHGIPPSTYRANRHDVAAHTPQPAAIPAPGA